MHEKLGDCLGGLEQSPSPEFELISRGLQYDRVAISEHFVGAMGGESFVRSISSTSSSCTSRSARFNFGKDKFLDGWGELVS